MTGVCTAAAAATPRLFYGANATDGRGLCRFAREQLDYVLFVLTHLVCHFVQHLGAIIGGLAPPGERVFASRDRGFDIPLGPVRDAGHDLLGGGIGNFDGAGGLALREFTGDIPGPHFCGFSCII